MRRHRQLLAVALIAGFAACEAGFACGQVAASQTTLAAAPAKAAAAAGAVSGDRTTLANLCKSEARDLPAYSYCDIFVDYLQSSTAGDAIRAEGLVNFSQSPANLASAYALRRLASLGSSLITEGTVDKMVDKAALTAPTNVQKRQTTSPVAASGSTSLVAKTAETSLLAVAVESGALTQSQSGNAITLQANLDHLLHEAYAGNADLGYLPHGTPILENFTVSASLAANSNNTLMVPTTGSATTSAVGTSTVAVNSSATKLSSLSVNYEFNNPLTAKKLAKYKGPGFVVLSDATLSGTLLTAENNLAKDFAGSVLTGTPGCNDTDYATLKKSFLQTGTKLDASSFKTFVSTFDHCFDTISSAAESSHTTIDSDLLAFTAAFQADIADFQSKLKKDLSSWDLSAQYVYNKPVNQPETHDFRVVGSGNISKVAASTWTVNAAWTLYGNVPAGAQYGRLKDAQFSGELDRNLGSKSNAPTFSLAGYGQYQDKPSVLNITSSSVPSGVTLPANAQVFLAGTQGWLGVVQAKLTLRLGSAQIPIAGKWSNKTDLLDTKNKLGAQFGVSYDFSKLKQLVGLGSN